ncbi:MAG TPA: Ricin and poly(3-hydroxybutyrate) depolymerase fusion [Polyangiaceae bacterium]|nr:Ricin and poly(3-hydroxybutyrate) depolymerase fusion [Polyangiaceae bacterium]
MRKSLGCAALTSALLVGACGNQSDDDAAKGGAGQTGTSGMPGGGASNAGSGGSSGSGTSASGGTAGSSTGGTSGGTGGASGGTGGSAGSGVSNGGAAGAGGPAAGGSAGSGTAGAAAGSSPGGAAGSSMAGAAGSGMGGSGGGLTGPVPSMGCGKGSATPPDGDGTISVGGKAREYIIRIPSGYDNATPNRIIFAFHGMSGSAKQVDNGDPPNMGLDPTGPYYGIKEHADNHTIFVAGQADGSWQNGDIDYVKALVEKFKGELCLDESRILATGFSMGGIMTLRVACNMADVFRAVAPMSCSLSAASCPAGGGHIAYWSSHGTDDTTINISNGRAARDEFAKRNGCSMDDPQPIGNDGCVAYQGCDEGYPVNWCEFEGIHEPPPFSGPEIWGFLSQF